MTFTRALATNNYGRGTFIVSATPQLGTHTTIAAANAVASAGDTIFIRNGTYTENFTAVPGVSYVGDTASAFDAQSIIVGKITITTAGNYGFSGLRLRTNSDYALVCSGANACTVNITDCYLDPTNNSFMNYTNSNAASRMEWFNCFGIIGTTATTWFTNSAAGWFRINGCFLEGKATASTSTSASSSVVDIRDTYFAAPLEISGTSNIRIHNCDLNPQGDTLPVTVTSTASSDLNIITNSRIRSSTYTTYECFTVAVGATLQIHNCSLGSANGTQVFSGAGTVQYTGLACDSQSNIGASLPVGVYSQMGKFRAQSQPAFCAFNSATDSNQTGDGTEYTCDFDTEIFDQNSNFSADTFTAPVTGRYQLNCNILCQQCTTAMNGKISIATSNRTWNSNNLVCETGNNEYNYSVLCDMDASDTAVCKVLVGGGTKVVDIYGDGTDCRTTFNGYLAC
jgi:hypothetical protein